MSIQDMIKKSVLESGVFDSFNAPKMAISLIVALLLGAVIYMVYSKFYVGVIFSRSFAVTLVGMTLLTCMVTLAISTNIVISLGMVGALSIVRFRTAIKDSRDTVYIFWTIIVGICCGVGDYLVAAVGSSAIFLIFLIMGAIRSDNRMLLIIRAKRSRCENIEAQVFRYFGTGAVLRVKNTTEENAEYIYELSRRILEKAQKQHPTLIDDFYNLGQIESVNIVAQSDEIYN